MNTFVICNNKEEVQSHVSCWGNATFELSITEYQWQVLPAPCPFWSSAQPVL